MDQGTISEYPAKRLLKQKLIKLAKTNPNELLSKEETLARDDLNDLIDKRIRVTTRLAYDHNPFLHKLFQSAGINPHSDISGRKDLMTAYKKGVRTTSADIEKCYPDYAPQVPLVEIWSSGSSGKSKKVFRSRTDIDRKVFAEERCLFSAGVSSGERLLRFSSPPPYASSYNSSYSAFFKNLMIRTLVFRVPTMPKNAAKGERERIAQSFIEMIYDFNPDYVRGQVFALYNLAQFLTDYGFSKERLDVKSVIFTGEPTTEEVRRAIGELWSAEPFDSFNSSEIGTIAYECKSHSGMHVNETDVFLATIDPTSGEETAVNEIGIDLCTSMYEDGELPGTFFINYSLGDKIALLPEACTCGNRFRLMTHPMRDTKKKLLSGYGFDVKEQTPLLARAIRKLHKRLSM